MCAYDSLPSYNNPLFLVFFFCSSHSLILLEYNKMGAYDSLPSYNNPLFLVSYSVLHCH